VNPCTIRDGFSSSDTTAHSSYSRRENSCFVFFMLTTTDATTNATAFYLNFARANFSEMPALYVGAALLYPEGLYVPALYGFAANCASVSALRYLRLRQLSHAGEMPALYVGAATHSSDTSTVSAFSEPAPVRG
jgi:hypothetical protein